MKRKMTIVLILITSVFFLNFFSINIIEKCYLNEKSTLEAGGLPTKGWKWKSDRLCYRCEWQQTGGCAKVPEGENVCAEEPTP